MASSKNTLNQNGSEFLNKRRKRYNDDEALAVIDYKSSPETRNRDTVHLALERLWFECVSQYVDPASPIRAVWTDMDMAPVSIADDLEYNSNHIQSFVMRQVARLSAGKGKFQTLPVSSDWRDQRAAKVGDQLLEHYHTHLNLRQLRRDLAFWQVVCGTGFIYTKWDAKAGSRTRIYRNPIDENQSFTADQLDDSTRNMYDLLEAYSDKPEGDIETESLGPFQVLIPSTYTNLARAPWMIIERIRSMEWLWENYPSKAKDISPQDFLDAKMSLWWRRLAGIVQRHGSVIPGTSNFADESVVVREFWRPPGALVEQGAYIVACKSMLLENSPHPAYSDGLDIRFPVRMARFQQVPGRLWGMGMVEHLIDPQREYNRTRSQVIQHRDMLSHPQWLAPKGANLTSTRVNIGDLWEYDIGRRPELVSPPGLSQAHVVTQDSAMNDMRLIASQSEVSQGQTMPGVRSGTAIRALQERDMETVGPSYEEHEEAMQGVSTDILKLAAKYIEMPRAIRIYGKDKSVDVQYFKGSDLRGNTTVMVAQGSMAPKSKAVAQENVMNLLQLGALNPQDPEQARKIYDALDIGELDDSFTLYDRNRRRANIENDLFLNREPDLVTGRPPMFPDVQDHDDHMVHIQEHTAFMLTDAWEDSDPMIKMATKAHVLKHQQFLAKLAMVQQQQQAAQQPQGSPPRETGQPSAPKRNEQAPVR